MWYSIEKSKLHSTAIRLTGPKIDPIQPGHMGDRSSAQEERISASSASPSRAAMVHSRTVNRSILGTWEFSALQSRKTSL